MSDSLDKRTKGWLALRGLWGKRKKRGGGSLTVDSEVDDSEDYSEVKRSIPKVSEEDLRLMG